MFSEYHEISDLHKIQIGGIVLEEENMFNSTPFEIVFTIIVGLLVFHFALKVIGGKSNAGIRLMGKNFRFMPFPTCFGGYLAGNLIEKMKAAGSTAKPHGRPARNIFPED
jgi:hypothetical protein